MTPATPASSSTAPSTALYAPTLGRPDGGSATVAANWLLSQPEGLLDPRGRKPVRAATRSPRPAATPHRDSGGPGIDGRFRIVDAGSAAKPLTGRRQGRGGRRVRDLRRPDRRRDQRCARRAPRRWWPTPGRVSGAPAPSREPARCLPCRVEPLRRPRRCWPTACTTGRAHHARRPATCTTSCATGGTACPTVGRSRAPARPSSALVEHYNGMGSTSADGLQAVEELVGWVPERGGVANIGLVAAVPFPTTVTHYVSTGAVWERTVADPGRQYGGEYGRLYAPRRTYVGGSTTHDTWFGGPIGSRVSPLASVTNGNPPPTREGNELFLSMGAFTDAAGHLANSDIFSTEYSGQIYVDDVLEHDIFASVFMNVASPAGDHRYPRGHRHPAQEPVLAAVDRDQDRVDVRVRPAAGLPAGAADARHRLRDAAVVHQHGAGRDGTTSRSGSRCRTRSRCCRSSSGASTSRGTAARPGRPATTRCGDTSCKVQVRNEAGGQPACASRPRTLRAAR